MVVFVELDDESEPPEDIRLRPHWDRNGHNTGKPLGQFGVGNLSINEGSSAANDDVELEAITATQEHQRILVAEALGCYPVVISIASHIDLNTLDALAQSCRQVRASLIQYRKQLLSSTLHCENEDVEPDPENTLRSRARAATWYFVKTGREGGNGKIGDCARDLVGGCRRCNRVVCRNCTIKPPSSGLLKHRHRRLCAACSKAPLSSLASSSSTNGPNRASESTSPINTNMLKLALCNCATEGVWLCQPCGRSLRSADSEYEGVWRWRTRYLPSLGGLGVGIGEGDRGVECSRGKECIAAREVEQETDCDAEDAREIESRAASPSSSPSSPPSSNGSSINVNGHIGPGYARHEIEGIGGVLKKKLVTMVKVGACVPEWGDEKQQGRFLIREAEGRARSWCGWCWRAVPGAKDVLE
ncbi:hypothetical protein HYALB_00013226 [Hymenoscyphus albidus]|uniref:Uncharacterized protein n=1 Tax=Hymenoscyphus albidus TaxID=595503 RepID=A0A9N9LU25_9HELO|nr:hypothetical protein HYALB_00013226 [Hymenoscyphus albidus]